MSPARFIRTLLLSPRYQRRFVATNPSTAHSGTNDEPSTIWSIPDNSLWKKQNSLRKEHRHNARPRTTRMTRYTTCTTPAWAYVWKCKNPNSDKPQTTQELSRKAWRRFVRRSVPIVCSRPLISFANCSQNGVVHTLQHKNQHICVDEELQKYRSRQVLVIKFNVR